jgi:lysozyme family protein
MASFDRYWPLLQRLEGARYVEDPLPTMRGITIETWQRHGYDKDGDGRITVADVKRISAGDAYRLYKRHYWDVCRADQIQNQAIAELVVDFLINGGPAIASLQRAAGAVADGKMGTHTLTAVNRGNAKTIHARLLAARKAHFDRVAGLPGRARYYKGWMNRLLRFRFTETEVATRIGLGTLLLVGGGVWAYQKWK